MEERRIEHAYPGGFRELFSARVDNRQCWWIMQRGERAQSIQCRKHVLCESGWLDKAIATVDDAMPDRSYSIK